MLENNCEVEGVLTWWLVTQTKANNQKEQKNPRIEL